MKSFHSKVLAFFVIIILLTSSILYSQVYVNGYYRADGTYVKPHYRSNPDGNPYNNWSYPGNRNPYTGKIATGNPQTYLRNYYKLYPNKSTSTTTYSNYTSLLVYSDYEGIKNGNSYTFTNNYGIVTGYLSNHKKNSFKIFDGDHTHIGYVNIKRNGKIYEVYDLYGYRVSTNKFKIKWPFIGTILIGGVIFSLIIDS